MEEKTKILVLPHKLHQSDLFLSEYMIVFFD